MTESRDPAPATEASPPARPATGAPTEPSAPVRTLGRFELLEEIGRGGMGVVYRARDPGLDRIVAIKGLLGARAGLADPEAARLVREARAAARLSHPNIVAVHEVGEADGQSYLVMDFVAGRMLVEHVIHADADLRTRARLVRDVALAIAHAHAQGILHRDLKPENVLVDGTGRPFVTDFGLAKDLREGAARLTADGALLGTPAYMAPEQAEGRPVDVRADVWGLGGILYAVLTHEPPFEGDSLPDLLYRLAHAEPVRPSVRQPRVPRDLETICLKCLEKEPGRRYATAQEVADDLDRWLRGEAVRARPTPAAARAWRWAARRKGLAAALAVALATTAVAGLLGARAWRDAAERRRSVLESDFYRLTEVAIVQAIERRRLGDAAGLARVLNAAAEGARARLAEDEDSAAAWFVEGWVARLGERPADAERALERAARLKPGDPAILYQRGLARAALVREAMQREIRRLRAAEPAGSVRPLDELTRLAETDPRIAAWRTAAEADFALFEDPPTPLDGLDLAGIDQAASQTGRGLLALYRGEPRAAETLLRNALGLDPYRDEAWDGLLETLQNRLSSADLARLYEQAVGRNRGRWTLWLGLADARAWMVPDLCIEGRVADGLAASEAALEALDRAATVGAEAAEVDGIRARMLLTHAFALRTAGRDEAPALRTALACARRAAAAGTDLADADLALGQILRLLGESRATAPEEIEPLLQEAGAALARCLSREPNHFGARSERSRVELTLYRLFPLAPEAPDRYARGLADLDACIQAHPRQPLGWLHRAEARLVHAENRFRLGLDAAADIEGAARDLDQVLALGRGDWTEYLARRANLEIVLARRTEGTGEEKLRHLKEAERHARAVLALLPHDSAARTCLAQALFFQADEQRRAGQPSLASYREAAAVVADLPPGYREGRYIRGLIHLEIARQEQEAGVDVRQRVLDAIEDVTPTTTAQPDFAPHWWRLADLHDLLADCETAQGRDPRALMRQAVGEYAQGNRLRTTDAWSVQREGELRLGLSWAEEERGVDPEAELARAIEAFGRALDLRPGYATALVNRGSARKTMGQHLAGRGQDPRPWFEDALADLRAARAADPGQWIAALYEGEVLELLDRPAEAVAAYEAAEKIAPGRFPDLPGLLERARRAAAEKRR